MKIKRNLNKGCDIRTDTWTVTLFPLHAYFFWEDSLSYRQRYSLIWRRLDFFENDKTIWSEFHFSSQNLLCFLHHIWHLSTKCSLQCTNCLEQRFSNRNLSPNNFQWIESAMKRPLFRKGYGWEYYTDPSSKVFPFTRACGDIYCRPYIYCRRRQLI